MAVARRAVARRARGCRRADSRRRPRPARRARRLARAGRAGPGDGAPAARRARAHAVGQGTTDGGAREREGAVLSAAAAVVTTSAWARRALLELYSLPGDRVHVAEPGVDPAELAPGTATAGALLSVAAVIPGKGHDVLARRTRDAGRLSLAVPVRRQPRARPGIRREAASPRRSTMGWTAACASRARRPAPSSPAATRPRTCWCSRRAARPTGWSSPRRSRAACRSSPPTSAGCRRLWVTAPTAPGRACSSRPTIRSRCATRFGAWLEDARPAPAAAPRGTRAARVALPLVGDDLGRRRRPRGGGAMTVEAIRVSPSWLDLRERADAAARSRELVAQLRAVPDRWLIHDLACGGGSMGRWLAPLLPGPQHWVLHDRDADLLAVAALDVPRAARDGARVRVETRLSDITKLGQHDFAGATLVTASALLDLLTGDELAALIHACAEAGCPVLFTLSVTGRVALLPADPLDARVGGRIRRAPAPHDAARAPARPGRGGSGCRGFPQDGEPRSSSDPSPWRLGATESDLAVEWLTGWVDAACEHEPALAPSRVCTDAGRLREARPAACRHRRPCRPVGAAVRGVRRWVRPAVAVVVLAVVIWRLGTGPFLAGVDAVDGRALLAAAAIFFLTTVCSAWRWTIVSRGLGVRLSLPAAVAAYYRAVFLNLDAPGRRRRRRPSRRQPRPRGARRRPRPASRRVGAHRRAGRAGGAGDRPSSSYCRRLCARPCPSSRLRRSRSSSRSSSWAAGA